MPKQRIKITPLASGDATISVRAKDSMGYTPPLPITLNVSVNGTSIDLADCTPAEIKAKIQENQHTNLWTCGDSFPVTLSGSALGTDVSGTWDATVLGLNHNSALEGNRSMHFALGSFEGKDITFCDSKYATTIASPPGFCMNPSSVDSSKKGGNEGGWRDSYMRASVLPAFESLLPQDLLSVLSRCSKWTSNGPNKKNTTADVITETSDLLWLLSEWEVYGFCKWANEYEQNYQAQYCYYLSGANVKRWMHNNQTTPAHWYLRSPQGNINALMGFCRGDSSDATTPSAWTYSASGGGVVPCFAIVA